MANRISVSRKLYDVILLHPVALCNYDLGVIITSGANNIYIDPLFQGTFFFLSFFLFGL
jgi:hypothetical protein